MRGPSKMTFQGGPLDGQTRERRNIRGRWPAAVDGTGQSIPVGKVDRAMRLDRGFDFYVNAAPIPTTDGSIHRRFDWWGDKGQERADG